MHLTTRSVVVLLLLAFAFTEVGAQSSAEWTVYSSLDRTNDVVPTSRGGFLVGTDGGAYRIDEEGRIVEIWRSNGELLALRVTALGEDPFTGDIYFGSDNGSVSVLRSGGWWTYVGDLARSGKPLREITGFYFSESFVYILSGFGVSQYSRVDSTLRDSWTRLGPIQPDTRVNDMVIANDSVFVATAGGLAVAPATGRDLADPLNWRGVGTAAPCGPEITSVEELGGTLLLGGPDGLCRYVDGTLQHEPGTPAALQLFIAGSSGGVAAAGDRLYRIDAEGRLVEIGILDEPLTSVARSASGLVLVGKRDNGVALVRDGVPEFYVPPGPVANTFVDLAVTDQGVLWAASGSRGVSRLDDQVWTTFGAGDLPALTTDAIRNLSIDHTGRVWGGSFGDGFFRFTETRDDVVVERFDEQNTPLQDVNSPNPGFTVGENVVSDASGVVWALNWDNTDGRRNALYSYRYGEGESPGTWQAHPFSGRFFSYTKTYRWIAVDYNGTKWLGGVDKPQGLLYFVDGADGMPGEWNSLTTSNGLPSNAQTSLLVDQDGELWVGTPAGATILVNPWAVRQEGPTAAVFREVPALADIYVWDIAVDALNRKWVGTEQGIFLMSSDGTELLQHYTTTNSPLPDDGVLSVAVDEISGAVYFGTRNGLSRLETTAVRSTASERITSDPQPFIHGRDERIRLAGLPSGATIKVLTLDGRLLREFPSPGGAVAYWDGLDADGLPVPSGVYLVVAEGRDGERGSGKIAVLRR